MNVAAAWFAFPVPSGSLLLCFVLFAFFLSVFAVVLVAVFRSCNRGLSALSIASSTDMCVIWSARVSHSLPLSLFMVYLSVSPHLGR